MRASTACVAVGGIAMILAITLASHIIFPAIIIGSADFGKITAGLRKSKSLEIQNLSPVPLQIEYVKTSCSCTASDLQTGEIIPGWERREFHITLDSTSHRGKFEQLVAIQFRGKKSLNILRAKADISVDLVLNGFSPELNGQRSRPLEEKFLVRWTSPGKYSITGASTAGPFSAVRVASVEDNDSYEVYYSRDANRSPQSWHDTIYLKTSMPDLKNWPVDLYGTIKGTIEVAPSQWMIGDVNLRLKENSMAGRLLVKGPYSFKINSIVSPDIPDIRIKYRQVSESAYEVEMLWDVRNSKYVFDLPDKSVINSQLTISTNVSGEERVKIPVLALIDK